jgi:hypothetical protein
MAEIKAAIAKLEIEYADLREQIVSGWRCNGAANGVVQRCKTRRNCPIRSVQFQPLVE